MSVLSTLTLNTLLHESLHYLANLFVIVLEFMGLIIIVSTAVKSFIGWIKKDPHARLNLFEGMGMALTFKLAGEILKTVVVKNMSEILQVAAITALRAAITFLIHWEMHNEEKATDGNHEN